MNAKEFDFVVESRINAITEVLKQKNAEYSSTTDRLHNFKVAAQLSATPISPEEALMGMLRKHLVSVIDMVEDTKSYKYPSEAMRSEKIGDSINYLILLEALFIERSNSYGSLFE